ncbi:MAG: hypothetical protein AAF849_12025 [Bacteroidota bacterium]
MKTYISVIFIALATITTLQSQQTYYLTWTYASDSCKVALNTKSTGDFSGKLSSLEELKKEVGPDDTLEVSVEIPKDSFESLVYLDTDNKKVLMTADELYMNSQQEDFEFNTKEYAKFLLNKPKYPYRFTLNSKTDSCSIVLGDPNNSASKAEGANMELLALDLNILRNVEYNNIHYNAFVPKASNMKKRNSIVVIDCSMPMSGQSSIYRLKEDRVKQEKPKKKKLKEKKLKEKKLKEVRYLKYGEHVKFYLYNFNPYLYNVVIDDKQSDVNYKIDSSFINRLPEKKERAKAMGGSREETANNDTETNPLEKIQAYAIATKQLENFITSVKDSKFPDANLLTQNKITITQNLEDKGLSSSQEVEILYNELAENIKSDENIKKIYKVAQSFSAQYAEMQSLSYTLEAFILPVQIKSFDQVIFEITIEDKEGKEVASRDYIYQIIGGIKVDQTFGFVVHGIHDEEYALKPVTIKDTMITALSNGGMDTTINDVNKRQIIEDESPSKVSIGLSTMTHFYYRTGFVNIGPEIGFAFDIGETQRIRYLLGLGCMFQDGRHRVSLNGGFSYGQFQKLSANQFVGDLLDGNAVSVPNLVNKGKLSWYFGISYNVPINTNKTQITKLKN